MTVSRPTISVPIKVERLSSHEGEHSGGSVEDGGGGHQNAQYHRSVDNGGNPEVRHRYVPFSYPYHLCVIHVM